VNILPFVIVIVLILGMFSLSQINQISKLSRQQDAYVAHAQGIRDIRNQMADRECKKILRHDSKEKQPPKIHDRQVWMGSSCSRVNLYPLLAKDNYKQDLRFWCKHNEI